MGHNWKIIRKKLYGTLGSPGRGVENIAMYNEGGNRTIEPLDATRFFVTFKSNDPKIENFTILAAIRDEGQLSHIDLKTPDLLNDLDFNMILELLRVIRKTVGDREGIKINWQDFDGAIDPREEAVNNIKESKDIGKISGTAKSSFQRVGTARLIIRHTDTVNEDKHGARTRHIRAIFVENKAGERFAYPHLHLTGARAFARHISQGGANHDEVSRKIFALSEDYMSLRRASALIRTGQNSNPAWVESIRESMQMINRSLKGMQGPRKYETVSQELIKESSGVIDENAITALHSKLAESCCMQPEDPGHADLGVAARYITGMPRMTQPMVFSWIRRPDLTMHVQQDARERLKHQVMELAMSCGNQQAREELARIAEMIGGGEMPSEFEMELVKEAMSDGMSYTPTVQPLEEEVELDEFLSQYDPHQIFSESVPRDEDIYIPGIDGEIIDRKDNMVLIWRIDDYGDNKKNEYEVYRKEGDEYQLVRNLDMPYDRPASAIDAFRKGAEAHQTDETHVMEEEQPDSPAPDDADLIRIKNLAGI